MKYVTALLETLWGLYAWAIFLFCVLFSLIAVTFVPGLERRRRIVAGAARAAFVFSGATVSIDGVERLPAGHCVVVANHASYVDGPLLKGYLPPHFSFVIKGEMRNVPVAHFLLRRAGSRFVERFTAAGSARDAREIVRAAQGGQSLGFFPEGTFIETPGIGRFRGGAFAAAIKGDMPIVPIAIFGTRDMMPAGRLLPRPRPIRIRVLEPIEPTHPAFAENRSLADEARRRILAVHDEPDLLAT